MTPVMTNSCMQGDGNLVQVVEYIYLDLCNVHVVCNVNKTEGLAEYVLGLLVFLVSMLEYVMSIRVIVVSRLL